MTIFTEMLTICHGQERKQIKLSMTLLEPMDFLGGKLKRLIGVYVCLVHLPGEKKMKTKIIISAVKVDELDKLYNLIESLIIAGFNVTIEPLEDNPNGDI
jgi:hypothetical protein